MYQNNVGTDISIFTPSLRAQKDKPVEIDQFDVSLFWEVWLLLCIWAWGMGYSYGEVLVKWWIK